MNDAKIVVGIGGDTRELESSLNKGKSDIQGFESTIKEVGRTIATVFAIDKISGFIGDMVKVRSEFEKFSAVLGNSMQSQEAANKAMSMLQTFAKETPYQLTEITEAYVKMVNRGLRPTKEELTKLGDFAAVTGKSFDQLVEAIMDVNNPERWKEFGVKAETTGNKVKISFNGMTKEVERTTEGAMKAVEAFAAVKGVTGSMAVQMDTLGGKVSNMKDAWDQMLVSIGDSSIWKKAAGFATDAITKITEAIKGSDKINSEIASESLNKLLDKMKGKPQLEVANALRDRLKDIGTLQQMTKEAIEKTSHWYNALHVGGFWKENNLQRETLDSYKKEEALINSMFRDNNWFEKLQKTLNAGVDPSKSSGVKAQIGYIEELKNHIKDLKEKLEKVPNTKNFLFDSRLILEEIDFMEERLKEAMNLPKAHGKQQLPSDILQGEVSPMWGKGLGEGSNKLAPMAMPFVNLAKQLKQVRTEILDIANDIKNGLADVVTGIAEGIGEALATGNIESLFKSFIGAIAGFAQQLGKLLIAWGIGQIALKKSISNPWVAIAAGAALVAIGAAIKSVSSNATGSGSNPSQGAAYGSASGGQGNATSNQLVQKVEFDIRGDVIRALIRNDNKVLQRTK